MRMESSFQYIITLDSQDLSGLPRYWKTGNLDVCFSRKGRRKEFVKNIKNMFLQRDRGNLPPTQGKF